MQRWRSRDDVVHMAREALIGANQCERCLAAAAAVGSSAAGGGSARPDLALFTTFSPVFFFSRVIKSGVSVGGARVGRGAAGWARRRVGLGEEPARGLGEEPRRGVSRCEARTSGGLAARFQPCPRSQLMPRMPWA